MTGLLIALGWGGLGYVMGHMVRQIDSDQNRYAIRTEFQYLFPPPFNWLFPIKAKGAERKEGGT